MIVVNFILIDKPYRFFSKNAYDELEDEELELSEAYCEGLEDAIKKIASLPTE